MSKQDIEKLIASNKIMRDGLEIISKTHQGREGLIAKQHLDQADKINKEI